MADTVKRVQYFTVGVPDEPGAGVRVLTPLEQAGVNLTAYLGFPERAGRAQLDLIPDDAAKLTTAAARAGIVLDGPKWAFLIQGSDRTGVLAAITRKLGEARINITAAFAACDGGGHFGMMLWVRPADYEGAAKTLGAE